MEANVDLLKVVSPLAQKYITIDGVSTTKTYNYEKRGFKGLPVFNAVRHAQKCKTGESWIYFAIPLNASLGQLERDERLYVGAQTQDRMFRGDGLGGNNFHHAEMRAGNGKDNPAEYLKQGNKFAIYRVNAFKVEGLINQEPSLESLKILVNQKRTAIKHLGWWFEQYILFSKPGKWRWNTEPARKEVVTLFS